MLIYHGSATEVLIPDISRSRVNIDFGIGFYTSKDIEIAKRWACKRNEAIVNIYEINIEDFKVKQLNVDEEWLYYVTNNIRGNIGEVSILSDILDKEKYDIIIGPTVDDKLIDIVDSFFDEKISEKQAIEIINKIDYTWKLVIKNQLVIEHIKFIKSIRIHGSEKEEIRKIFNNENMTVIRKVYELLKNCIKSDKI